MARYSVKSKSYVKKGHMGLLVLPLSIITLFCFGFVLMQSKNYKAGHTQAASTSSSKADQTGALPDTGTSSYDKLPTVPQADQNTSASPSGSGQTDSKTTNSNQKKPATPSITSTVHDMVNKNN